MNKKESIDNWLRNDKESYFNFLNELKGDKFNNHLSATKKPRSESGVHNNRSFKQKPNHPITETDTTPVNKKKGGL